MTRARTGGASGHTSGRYRVSAVMTAVMIGGGLLLTGVTIALAAGWLPTNDPDQPGMAWIMASIFGLMTALGAYITLLRIDWDQDGLRIRMPGLTGVSHRTYAWSDLRMVRLMSGYWRIDCSDGGYFRLGVGNMVGGVELLREIARRRIPADHDILTAIDSERVA